MSTDVLYKESMYWISQFQTFRNESEMIKKSLLHSVSGDSDLFDKFKKDELLQSIVDFNEHLNDTEEIILASINHGIVYRPGHYHSYDFSMEEKSSDDLFDKVKLSYNDFIELQRSASYLLHHSYADAVPLFK